MTFLISIALMILGVGLLVCGYDSSHSLASHLSSAFNGHPTDRTFWLVIGGAVCTLLGLGGFVRSCRTA